MNPFFLPGTGISIDVVNIKCSNCPAGDISCCIGEGGYPTLAFEVVLVYDQENLGILLI